MNVCMMKWIGNNIILSLSDINIICISIWYDSTPYIIHSFKKTNFYNSYHYVINFQILKYLTNPLFMLYFAVHVVMRTGIALKFKHININVNEHIISTNQTNLFLHELQNSPVHFFSLFWLMASQIFLIFHVNWEW